MSISLLGFACGDKEEPQSEPAALTSEKDDANKKPARPAPQPEAEKPVATKKPAAVNRTATTALAPIRIKLPKPLFMGTPRNLRVHNLEKPRGKPRPPFLAPADVKNVALNKAVTGSDEDPIIGELDCITDGEVSGADGTYVDLSFGTQYVHIDLEGLFEIFAVLVWHFHQEGRVYHDVVVQVADDADFIANVRTLFNNDDDNSSGLGVGKDRPYLETHEGKLIDAGGVKASHIRLYSRGNTSNEQNHYVEVQVFGRPVR